MMRTMLAMTVLLASVASAQTRELNELKGLEVSKTPAGAQIVVSGTRAPVFTVFRLNDPDRLVIDLTNASTAPVKGHHDGVGPVSGIVTSQFSDGKTQVGRVLVGLDHATRYDVHADEGRLIVTVDGDLTPAEPAPLTRNEAAPAAKAEPEASPARPAEVAVKAAPPPAPRADGVVASHLDEKPVKRPATVLKSVAWTRGALKLVTDGEIAKFELIELENPPRLALDLYGLKSSARAPRGGEAMVREVRLGAWPDKVRVVVEASGAMPGYKAARRSDGLLISLSAPATVAGPAAAPTVAAAAPPDGEPVEVEIDGQRLSGEVAPTPVAPSATLVDVKAIEFHDSNQGGSVEIKLTGNAKYKVERPDPRSAVLTLEGARIAHALERSLDTTELDTPVRMVSAFAVPGAQNRVRVVVAANGAIDDTVVPHANATLLSWRIAVKGARTEEVVAANRTAGFSTEAKEYAAEGAPQKQYVGKKVSFEFKDIDIHNLLRIIAEISKKNIVVADDVTGKVTIRLRNVPWDQALELILRSKSLGQEELGNIVRVAKLSTLNEEAEARRKRREDDLKSRPLSVQLIPVNYAMASDIATRVKEVLAGGERAGVTVDTRTNTLIVRDLPDNMGKVRQMVANLDTQTPQVLIESRIVEASTRFSREVGIQWGGQGVMAAATGNPTGLVFPGNMAVVGGVAGGNNTGTAATPNYAVSLPVGAGDGSGGALGFQFGSAGGAVQLNLRLSALESQGSVKTISAPKITTLDNDTARISQGVSIPFSQVSAAGANTQFVEARLALEVTPHITQDGSVLMKIRAENNQPDPSNSGSNGQPGIARKEASTNVLVKDGDTTVIGGIYVRTGSSNQAGLPILSKIPVIGFFFRNYRELETKNELLIFITPRILNRQAVAQNQ